MNIKFRMHAVKRMFERKITEKDVIEVIKNGEIVINYPDDQPYPSCLQLAIVNGRPLHVVSAINEEEQTIIIITVYEPDPMLWDKTFKKRVK